MKYLIGIDGGTTKTKAVLFDLQGKEINKIAVDNEIITNGDCKEMDMDNFWESTATAVALLMSQGPAMAEEVIGVAVTGQGEGLWAINSEGRPVMNAILWNDGRAREEAWIINEKTPGVGKLVHRNIGCPVGSGSTLVLLRWLKKNHLHLYQQTKAVFFAKDWLRYCMTGRILTDFSDGGSSFLRFTNGGVPTQLMTVLGLPEAVDKFPGVLPASSVGGHMTPEAAAKMGLLPGIPVFVGALDVVSASLGVGAYDAGNISVVLGTTCASLIVHDKEGCDPTRYWRHFLPHVCVDKAVEVMSTLNGMTNIDWALKELLGRPDYALADQMVEMTKPGAGGVVYHPYLSTAGERMPFNNANAKASFFGISDGTSREQLLRAVYESIAFSIRDCMEGYNGIDKILISGGGATSGILPRIIADVNGATVAVSKGSEFAARGAVMAAGVGLGLYENFEDAVRSCCRLDKIYQAKAHPVYDRTYQLYRELRRAFAPLWQLRKELLG
ncbi:FGGY-family carbohydrate kinase [Eubacterium barkeri]|uniref:Xylulokinase n=1 Tax=Eubacterium barkeri TaxID=1528 RepID=A0A1H3GND5_EUBBA|nr:FGGY-family carbohydrate kinase [Eubacterium barkeri]SDY04842.1 xylulokinase [Eubacterium barkeri]